MSTILVSNEQFTFITILLKYLVSTEKIDKNIETYSIPKKDLENFILKKVVIKIDVKTKILKTLDEILASLNTVIGFYNSKSHEFFLTKKQICSLIKPIITKAALTTLNPIEKQKLDQFFTNFDCEPQDKGFFIELI